MQTCLNNTLPNEENNKHKLLTMIPGGLRNMRGSIPVVKKNAATFKSICHNSSKNPPYT